MSQPIGIAGAGGREGGSSKGLGTSPTQRKFLDIVDLSSNGFEVKIAENNVNEIYVKLDVDPARYPQLNVSKELCPYVGGVWWLHIELPERYPQASPSVGFVNRIFHPNVEEQSGSICLDVLNQTWSPMFTLTHALCNFLSQLLCYPNPHDPMNGEAAAVLIRDEAHFKEKVRKHTLAYANEAKALEAIALETDGRDFYSPDVSESKRDKRGSRASPGTAAGGPSSTPGTEGSSLEQKKMDDDDDVSSASDIDLD
eukprot:TRINITY_DN5845_c2_g1_i1.p1 TRINITY_DN5845_c2_g1~~TRINITY_DN5845_c2_g1_i1.p1  ORF type:complete len:255 (+),score=105.86 TRINITY_DN5845_c2_g1_i1:148-912(+)